MSCLGHNFDISKNFRVQKFCIKNQFRIFSQFETLIIAQFETVNFPFLTK